MLWNHYTSIYLNESNVNREIDQSSLSFFTPFKQLCAVHTIQSYVIDCTPILFCVNISLPRDNHLSFTNEMNRIVFICSK